MPWNVFVLGYDELGERMLRKLNHSEDYRIRPLLPLDEVVHADEYHVEKLLGDGFSELKGFAGSVDAIVSYWDFPSSALLPIFRQPFGLRGPSLEAVLKCEHKYWSRVEQARSIPECVPGFQAVDPFADDPVAQIELPYPFWIKPVKAHSSQLGFRIDGPEALRRVIPMICKKIGRLARPFTEVAAYAELPDDIAQVTGHHCIAESMISAGEQCTLEGYVLNGEPHIYGVIDTARHSQHRSVLTRYRYPSQLPEAVQRRMIEYAQRFITHIGYNDAPFNIEFYHDAQHDRIWLLEINSRVSRSHAALFELVDGAPHLQVMVDVGLGFPPRMYKGQGRYAIAAKHMIRVFDDGIVRRAPSQAEIQRVEERFPGACVELNVREDMALSDMLHQDSYSFELGVVFIGADNEQQLDEHIRLCEEMLPFEIEPIGQQSTA